MRHSLWAMAMLLVASGCTGGQDDPAPGETAPDLAVSDAALADAAPTEAPTEMPVAAGRSVEASNDLYEFSFSYPDAAGAIPRLKELFDTRIYMEREKLASSAGDERKEAKKQGYPFHPHSYGAKWQAVADLPGWLSLSADLYSFTGGAHGMSNFDSLLWDRRAETLRKPRDLFVSPDALRDAIREPFCDELDRQRETRRGEPVQRDSGQMFTECIDPVAQTLILGSTNGQTFDRIGILIAPYEAGPYVEGTYDVTLPVTGKVMAALKPQYRNSFSVGK